MPEAEIVKLEYDQKINGQKKLDVVVIRKNTLETNFRGDFIIQGTRYF